VESLLIRIKADGKEMVITPQRTADVEMPPYALIYSGDHKIIVSFEKEG
jgi:hypothetical protein